MKKKLLIYIGAGFFVGYIAGLYNLNRMISNLISPKETVKDKIKQNLGVDIAKTGKAPEIELVEKKELAGGIIRKKVKFIPKKGIITSAYFFHPGDTSKKYPAVIVFPGHGPGVENTCLYENSYEKAVARELAEQGFVVFSFDYEGIERSLNYNSHAESARTMLLKKKTILGKYVESGIKALDILQSIEYVNKDRIGAAGTSLGGHVAVYVAVLDERVKSVVDSSYFISYKELPENPQKCTCSYIPGSLERHDFPFVCSLIAPRPCLYILGKNDKQVSAQKAVKMIREIVMPEYEKLGSQEKIKVFLHNGGHEMVVEPAVKWFKKTLDSN
ncbi:MAG: alpha/beta hydrolase [Elusimicrobiota bacterium]